MGGTLFHDFRFPGRACVAIGATSPILRHRSPEERCLKMLIFCPAGSCLLSGKFLEQFRFTDRYRAYGLGEDKDFTFQVAQQYRLVFNKKATLLHLEATEMRPDKRLWGKKFCTGKISVF